MWIFFLNYSNTVFRNCIDVFCFSLFFWPDFRNSDFLLHIYRQHKLGPERPSPYAVRSILIKKYLFIFVLHIKIGKQILLLSVNTLQFIHEDFWLKNTCCVVFSRKSVVPFCENGDTSRREREDPSETEKRRRRELCKKLKSSHHPRSLFHLRHH